MELLADLSGTDMLWEVALPATGGGSRRAVLDQTKGFGDQKKAVSGQGERFVISG